MSIVNNIQGSLTQSQQPQQVQQQHADNAKAQQLLGEQQAAVEKEAKKNTISQQEDVAFTQVGQDAGAKDDRKGKKKKKTLAQDEPASGEDIKIASMWGGGLIDTQA